MSERFNGQVAIVTGAGSGIGRAVASRLASEGARLVLVDRDRDAVEGFAKELPEAVGVEADVSTQEGCANFVEMAIERFGTIDLVHSNAGVMSAMKNIAESDPADFDRVMAINARGVYLSLRAVLPVLVKKRGGSVVVTASIAAFEGSAGVAAYVASKHAAVGLVRSAALEVAADGVRVNAVCPGTTRTHLNTELHAQLERGELEMYRDQLQGKSIPMHRVGEPDEIANMVTWLLSDEARYVTGSTHVVDGGFTA